MRVSPDHSSPRRPRSARRCRSSAPPPILPLPSCADGSTCGQGARRRRRRFVALALPGESRARRLRVREAGTSPRREPGRRRGASRRRPPRRPPRQRRHARAARERLRAAGIPVALVTGSPTSSDYRDGPTRCSASRSSPYRSSTTARRLARVALVSVDLRPQPDRVRGAPPALPVRALGGGARRPGRREGGLRAGRDRRAATPTSSAASSSTRCARPRRRPTGDERERLYRLRKTCECGLISAELAEREDELENRVLAERVTFKGEEMPLRNAQAQLAVLPRTPTARQLGEIQAEPPAPRSTTTGSSCSASSEELAAELLRHRRRRRAQRGGEGRSRCASSRGALKQASDDSTAAYDALRERWFERLLGADREEIPSSFHTAVHAPALAARVDVHEGARDRGLPRRR